MNLLLKKAVINNIKWCEIVSETHGIKHRSSGCLWGLFAEAPPYYPDVITSGKDVTPRMMVEFIGDRSVLSIKDSFANLDIEPLGFNVLFEAEWIYHPPVTVSKSAESAWRNITNEEDLAKWTFATGLEKVIKPALLGRDDVKIFIDERNDNRSGFIANLGADVVGISNVFFTEYLNGNLWSDIVQVVSIEFPGLHMVGYEQDSDLNAAITSGWKSLGPLRIWIKSE